MNEFDVAIIGSGPAGASAALKLAENGISTVIIEKETLPRYKTCGGAFSYRGKRLTEYDVSSAVEREFYKLDIYFDKLDLHFSTKRDVPIVSMVMREDFDNLIVEKAKISGAVVLENHKLLNMTFAENITLHTSQGDVNAKYVIGADGALSPTAKLTGWKETRYLIPALEYEVEVEPDEFKRLSKEVRLDFDAVPLGYGWVFPKKNHLSIGVASARRTKINLKKCYSEYLELLNVKSVIKEEFHGFQIPLTSRKDGFARKNVFLVGDAAGFADPFSAEGITNAMLSGIMAAESIIESDINGGNAEELYTKKLEEKLLPEIKIAEFLSKFFYESKALRHFLVKKYGERVCEAMTDILIGDREYPTDIKKRIKEKIKTPFF